MTRRVKQKGYENVTYLVLDETEWDYDLEVIGHVWKTDEWIECDHADLELPTATEASMGIIK